MKKAIGFVLALMLSFSGCRKTPKPTPEPKPHERPKIQSFVPPTQNRDHTQNSPPVDADLVLQLPFSTPLNNCETYQPQLTLEILDTKTHFLLWTFTEAVRNVGCHPLFEVNANWDKNLKEGIDNLVEDLTRLAGKLRIY
jgi:hypothetical protein